MRTWLFLLVAFCCGPLACAKDKVCDPGSTQPCLCSDGAHGAQACADDGDRWQACACTKASSPQGGAQALTPDPPGAAPPANQPAAAQPGAAPARSPVSPSASAQPASNGNEKPSVQAPAGSPLGARCIVDRDCSSGECKGFKCVPKVGMKAPLGASCVVDGDCESLECKGFKCAPRK